MICTLNGIDVPNGNNAADLVYKITPRRNLMLTFLPPIKEKFDKAPVYFLIPGGGWHVETRQSMIDFSLSSVETLRNEGFAVVSIDYRVYKDGVVMREIITDCFDAKAANFSPLLDSGLGCWLDRVNHGARVKIDEEGVTAAAYTEMLLAGAAMPPKDEIDFILDRPFIFVITGSDGLPLFIGTVNNP